jgi:hypothetical protein
MVQMRSQEKFQNYAIVNYKFYIRPHFTSVAFKTQYKTYTLFLIYVTDRQNYTIILIIRNILHALRNI